MHGHVRAERSVHLHPDIVPFVQTDDHQITTIPVSSSGPGINLCHHVAVHDQLCLNAVICFTEDVRVQEIRAGNRCIKHTGTVVVVAANVGEDISKHDGLVRCKPLQVVRDTGAEGDLRLWESRLDSGKSVNTLIFKKKTTTYNDC